MAGALKIVEKVNFIRKLNIEHIPGTCANANNLFISHTCCSVLRAFQPIRTEMRDESVGCNGWCVMKLSHVNLSFMVLVL